jgi:hypothetical protein
MAAHKDRLYLVSTGNYENGVCSIEKESGKIIPFHGAVSTKKVEAFPLSIDEVANMTESEMWIENKTCYRAAVAKKKVTGGGRQLLSALSLPTKIVMLAADGIYFLNKTDFQSVGALPNPSEDAAKFRKIQRLSRKSVLAVSKSRILCIDSNTLEPSWSLDMPWALDNLDHFHINSIWEKHLYIRVFVDKIIKGCIVDKQTGILIKSFEANQTYWTQNLLALQNGNRVSIYLQKPVL